MATVAQVAKASLQKILVQGSEADFEPDEYQDYIFALNAYMLSLDAEGVALGFTVVDDLSDEVTVPLGALRGVIYNMAVEVAPDYNGVISQALSHVAKESMKVMRLIGQSIPTSAYSGNLPVGSGNEGGSTRLRDDHFYVDQEALILAETTGSIALETGTEALAS